jgi:hypothetical protein
MRAEQLRSQHISRATLNDEPVAWVGDPLLFSVSCNRPGFPDIILCDVQLATLPANDISGDGEGGRSFATRWMTEETTETG